MKKILNTLITLNILFIMACADNPDVSVFVTPAATLVILAFLRIYHKEALYHFKKFVEYLMTPQ